MTTYGARDHFLRSEMEKKQKEKSKYLSQPASSIHDTTRCTASAILLPKYS
jgi:hypothetical protein